MNCLCALTYRALVFGEDPACDRSVALFFSLCATLRALVFGEVPAKFSLRFSHLCPFGDSETHLRVGSQRPCSAEYVRWSDKFFIVKVDPLVVASLRISLRAPLDQ